MKCPKCSSDLVTQTRFGIEVDTCPNDHGTWLDYQELDRLEDERFKLDDEKGSLILSDAATTYHCPRCGGLLRTFEYRLYDLPLEYCPNKDGFWLDAGEEQRVLALMKQRKADMRRKFEAEAEWKEAERHDLDPDFEWRMTLLWLRSEEFFEQVRDQIAAKLHK
jgi:Zn-finger nucleic acid-binding protein